MGYAPLPRECGMSEPLLLFTKTIDPARRHAVSAYVRKHKQDYSDCQQTDEELVRSQNDVGKLTEVAFEEWFTEIGLKVVEKTDLRELRYGERSYSNDLSIQYEGGPVEAVSVKGCSLLTASGDCGTGWMYQLKTAKRKEDPILKHPEGKLVAFGVADPYARPFPVVFGVIFCPAVAFIPDFLTEPHKAKYKGNKTVIRLRDIEPERYAAIEKEMGFVSRCEDKPQPPGTGCVKGIPWLLRS